MEHVLWNDVNLLYLISSPHKSFCHSFVFREFTSSFNMTKPKSTFIFFQFLIAFSFYLLPLKTELVSLKSLYLIVSKLFSALFLNLSIKVTCQANFNNFASYLIFAILTHELFILLFINKSCYYFIPMKSFFKFWVSLTLLLLSHA
jgi:hypothetical protein